MTKESITLKVNEEEFTEILEYIGEVYQGAKITYQEDSSAKKLTKKDELILGGESYFPASMFEK